MLLKMITEKSPKFIAVTIPTQKVVCQKMAEKFGFYDKCLFHTTVEKTEWDEANTRWTVHTDRGDCQSPHIGGVCKKKIPHVMTHVVKQIKKISGGICVLTHSELPNYLRSKWLASMETESRLKFENFHQSLTHIGR